MVEHTAHSLFGVLAQLRILLVCSTDQPDLTRSLAREGYEVLTVDDRHRPLRLLRAFRPDVVLVRTRDVTILRQLRGQHPEVPLVAVVPDDVAAHRVAALDAGADDCVSEPFHHAELRARLRVVLRPRLPGPPRRRGWPRSAPGVGL